MRLKERNYWLAFNIFPGIGPKRFFYLLKFFGSAKKAWEAKEDKWKKTKLPQTIIKKFLIFRKKVDLFSEIIRLEKNLIRFLIIDDKEYPKNLKNIDYPPPLIYLKGRIKPQDVLSIAVVGTRKITPYGKEVTEKLVQGLAAYGFTIVSGLARGVDSLAHRVALGNGARTLAVIGSSLDNIYPPENSVLAQEIIKRDLGAVISLLPLGSKALKGHFPHRNRIISALSLGVLVTEGAKNSGAKITANYCLRQKRKLMAVPGPITSPMSEATADLIKSGGKLITKVEDILETFNLNIKFGAKKEKEKKIVFKNETEALVWQFLTSGSKHIDEIIQKLALPSEKVLALLTKMELEGKVKNIGQGNYILC